MSHQLGKQLGLVEEAVSGRWRPSDVDSHWHECGRWQAVAASVIGASHLATNGVRQDAFSVEVVGDVCIAILADGLGSAEFSHVAAVVGAQYVAKELKEFIEAQAHPQNWEAIVDILRDRASNLAEAFAKKTDETGTALLTTLLGVVVGPERGFLFNLGDGAALSFPCADAGNFSEYVVSVPEHGEYHGQVYPLLPETVSEHLRLSWFESSDRILVMTDGIAELSINEPEDGPSLEFVENFDRAMRATDTERAMHGLVEYLSSDRVSAATRDDKTLVWIRRRTDAPS